MTFMPVDEIEVDPQRSRVYEHGWQSWSPTTTYPAAGASARPALGRQQLMRFRPETPAPEWGFQGEGLLVVAREPGQAVRVYSGESVETTVPSIRGRLDGSRFTVSADGPVRVEDLPGGIEHALTVVGDRFAAQAAGPALRQPPTVWCSWYHYFDDVTEDDIVENLELLDQLDLPVDVVQVDGGWSAGVGDWLELSERFRSMSGLASRVADTGRRAGIWVAPFIVGQQSRLAREHPDWLVGDAGYNWDQRLYGLDLSHPAARDYLWTTFRGLREAGYDYFKLDFVYAGALRGRRHLDTSAVGAYRSGLELIREAVGPDSFVLGCGAPMLPSVGLVDAMRVSPDSYNPTDPNNGSDLLRGRRCVEARAWQHGRLWVNDADCLIARPGFGRREEWAAVVERYSGLRSVSDRLADLDGWGLDTTRQLLSSVPEPVPFPPSASDSQ